MSSLPPVPTALLLSFFEKATKELVSLSWDDGSVSSSNSSVTLSDFRILILQTQLSALTSVVDDYQKGASASTKDTKVDDHSQDDGSDEVISIEQVQNQLQTMETHEDFSTHLEQPLRNMTMAARQALARLVLQQELKHQQQENQPLCTTKSSSPPLTRAAVVDFCGLCQAVVQLDAVQEFLSCRLPSPIRDGHPTTLRLYDTDVVGKFIFPHERMQYIQKLYFTALGYHADTANQQLQGLIEGDAELQQIFTDTIHQLRQALAVATMHMQQEELNDFKQGGVTRVVSVKHSDSNNHDEMPQTIGMVRSDQEDGHDNTTNNNNDDDIDDMSVRMARDTAALEQTLLAQLLQMDSDERTSILEQARVAHDDLMTALSNLTTPSERVAYMTSSTALSKETRKLLLLHQIWQGLLDRNGGQPPKMASTRDRDY